MKQAPTRRGLTLAECDEIAAEHYRINTPEHIAQARASRTTRPASMPLTVVRNRPAPAPTEPADVAFDRLVQSEMNHERARASAPDLNDLVLADLAKEIA